MTAKYRSPQALAIVLAALGLLIILAVLTVAAQGPGRATSGDGV